MNPRILVLISLVSAGLVLGNDIFVDSTEKLINLYDGSYGTSFNIYLENDLDFTDFSDGYVFIGNDSNSFTGSFDGQGYIIKNLNISSSSAYVGLIGHSVGSLSVRNVVMDSSCSITSSYAKDATYVGGIVGCCETNSFLSENIVNMANVSYDGGKEAFVGGIIGQYHTYYHNSFKIVNCVNYGTVASYNSKNNNYIGGIWGYSGSIVDVHNCLNYGAIIFNEEESNKVYHIGGIAGHLASGNIEKCVNAGSFSINGNGAIVGFIIGVNDSYVEISQCYYDKKIVGATQTRKEEVSFNSDNSFEFSPGISTENYPDKPLIEELNSVTCTSCAYSRWVTNVNGNTVDFIINKRDCPIKLNSQLILLPNLADNEYSVFDGWYTDPGYTTLFTDSEVSKSMVLYGKFGVKEENYTITFDSRGGTEHLPISARYNSEVKLPTELTKGNCTLAFWETEYGEELPEIITVEGRDVTLYAVWSCTNITNIQDFIDFSKVVNSGANLYESTVVYLETDLDFSLDTSNSFEVIGRSNTDNHFKGSFDGQGHIISNLMIESSYYRNVGLFGFFIGESVRNLVLDSSCSIVGTYSPDYVFVGGIIGFFYSEKPCIIEGIVTMANITFKSKIISNATIGSIAGCIYGQFSIRNCINYGTVATYGESDYVYLGGIVGWGNVKGAVQNCANYGNLIVGCESLSGEYVGGIIGYMHSSVLLESCISSSTCSHTSMPTRHGSLLGFFDSLIQSDAINITNCIWTKDIDASSPAPRNPIMSSSFAVELLNKTVTRDFNYYAENNAKHEFHKWFTLDLNGGKMNTLNQKSLVVIQHKFPDPTKENNTFLYWCKDEGCYNKYDSNVAASDEFTDLYALWKKVIVTYDPGNGTLIPSSMTYGKSYELFDVSKIGFNFDGWFTEEDGKGKEITRNSVVVNIRDHKLYSKWSIINYTLRFVFNNSIDDDNVTVVDYNTLIIYPDDPEREGYSFNGWDNDTQFMPADNLTITALWTINNYTLRFVFNNSVDDDKVEILDFNDPISYPDGPTREGYTFYDWDSDSKSMPADNLNVTALWIINNYTLRFVFNNSVDDDNVTVVDYNTLIIYPDDPTREGYTFYGWDNDTQFMPADNLTITALWAINNYTLRFIFNNSVDDDNATVVDYNTLIIYPDGPTREGYTFYGWDNDTQFMPADNLTITALWTINNYILKFVFNNSVNDDKVSILDYNTPITYPDDPTKVGYTFYGWDGDSKSMPAGNLTITALWTINNYTLRFIFNNSVDDDNATVVDYNTLIIYPDDPTREGYTFYGWDNDTQFMPAGNLTITALWTINNYILKFVFNNSADNDKVEILDYNDPILYPGDPTKVGYTFYDWDSDSKFMPAGNLTITALWTINNYTLRFVFNNSMDEDKVEVLDYNTLVTYPDDPEREGYTFYDWDSDTQFMPADNLTITALWAVNNYTLRFIFNNSIDDDIVSILDYNDPISYPDDPEKEGYTFYDWDKDNKFMPAGNLTITALWTINNYTLRFVFNNSVDDDIVSILDYNTLITYPDDPEKEGYTFYKWDNDSKFIPAGNLTITALWIINNYTLRFIFNNSVDEDKVEIVDYNTLIIYPDDPTKEGYSFNGWDSDTKSMPADNLTIIALWTANTYNVTLDLNGGDYISESSKEVTFDSTYGSLPVPERIGYGFVGWFTDNIKDDEKIEYNTTVAISKNHTLYAHWDPDALTLILNATGGTPELSPIAIKYDDEYGSLPIPEKTGYSFDGWYTDATGGTKIEQNTKVTVSSSHTIYAHWTANNYTVIYDVNGGNIPAETEKNVTYDEPYGALLEAERTGYTFCGWYASTTSEEEITRETIVSTAKSHTLYAKWTINNYTLRFIFNNSVDDDVVSILDYNTSITYPDDPEREGYTFYDWDSDSKSMPADNLTITALWEINNYTLRFIFNNSMDDDKVEIVNYNTPITYPDDPTKEGYTFYDWDSDSKSMPADNLTITALWTINNYTLRFVFNNSMDDDVVSVLDYNDPITYPDNPEREGYTFYDWDKDNKFMPADNLTITALWSINSYTLTFVFNNGDDPKTKNVNYDDSFSYPDNPVKEGYIFDGWDKNVTNMPAGKLTIEAKWLTHMITIVFDKKDISEDDVKKRIEAFIQDDTKIEIIKSYDNDNNVMYIIKFVDSSDEVVKNFVEQIASDEELKTDLAHVEINGQEWVASDKDNTVLIVVIVLVVVVVIAAVVSAIILLYSIRNKPPPVYDDGNAGVINRIANQEVDSMDSSAFKSLFRKKKKIYPDDYVPPQSISDALINAGLDKRFADMAADICMYNGEVSKNKGYVTGSFTVEDAAAICLYTFDFGGSMYDMNPYRLLNSSLRASENKLNEIVKVRDILYLVMTALRKLPVVSGVTLYRAIHEKVAASQYKEGNTIVWSGFSSTSPDMNTTKEFLDQSIRDEKMYKSINSVDGVELEENNGDDSNKGSSSSGTLFVIEDGWGYNIQPYSRYPDEEEILIEPEREFEVVSAIDSEEFILITLRMKKTKVILPKVFGKVQSPD